MPSSTLQGPAQQELLHCKLQGLQGSSWTQTQLAAESCQLEAHVSCRLNQSLLHLPSPLIAACT